MAFCALLVAGCGDTESAGPASGLATADEPSGQGGSDLPRATGAEAAKRPKPKLPSGPTSPNVIARDLILGTGPAAERGDILVIRYVGGVYETGEELESGGSLRRPVGFRLGSGDWGLGFESGMPGMRVGGRRELIYPTSPADLPPGAELGETLVYIVDLVNIN